MISFIIPAYNAEKSLKRCVESIRSHHENYEIIIVENGSTDQTYELANSLDKVRVFQSEKGVSNARNMGLDHARGEWIAFVDADDYVLNSYEERDEDLIVMSYEVGSHRVDLGLWQENNTDIESATIMMLENPTKCMAVWGLLMRRDIIERYQLRFASHLRVAEDGDFTLRYLLHCKSIYFSSRNVYHYSLDDTSVMRSYDGRKTEGYIEAMNESKNAINDASLSIRKAFSSYVLMHFNVIMVRENYALSNQSSYKEKVENMKRVLNVPIFKEAYQDLSLKNSLKPRYLPFLLMKCHLHSLAGLIYVLRVKQNARKK
jgi:glycosyltransferase involved in cell wall biosynthesis